MTELEAVVYACLVVLAMAGWLLSWWYDERRERLRMAPPSQGTPVNVRIPPPLLAAIDQAAQAAGISRAEMIRQTLEKASGPVVVLAVDEFNKIDDLVDMLTDQINMDRGIGPHPDRDDVVARIRQTLEKAMK